MKEYKVAVVIPTYNEELYIENCIESVRNQSFPFEEMDVMIVLLVLQIWLSIED